MRKAAWLAAAALFACALAYGAWVLSLRLEERRHADYLRAPVANGAEVRFEIGPGSTMREVSDGLAAAGVVADAALFSAAAVREGLDRKAKAGHYLVEPGTSHFALMEKFASGDVAMERFAIVEGTTFGSVLARLAGSESVSATLAGLSPEEAWEVVAPESGLPPEGLLYPDTYLHGHGHADADILRASHGRLMELLEAEWPRRKEGLALESPYEAVILASIIEKETGLDGERGLVSSAFHNRLRIGMRLQSDPTVIYGLGEGFDGNLTRRHLEEDTPWNTYTRAGLPPTPIAVPSRESLLAALNPPESDYLYFVADGSGGHHFSKSLREHINAVNRYQRGRK